MKLVQQVSQRGSKLSILGDTKKQLDKARGNPLPVHLESSLEIP